MPRIKNTRGEWSTKKKDDAPRGLHHLPKRGTRPAGWQILFTCGVGHRHKEFVGPLKVEANKAWHARRNRVRDEPGWCPRAEQRQLDAEHRAREAQAMTVRQDGEQWLTAHVARECRERTAELYRSVFKHHVYPAIGDVTLGELKRSHVKGLVTGKAGAGLSRNTLKNILVPLRAMLNAAVDEERIAGNPAIRILKRKRGQTEQEARSVTTLTEEELSRVGPGS